MKYLLKLLSSSILILVLSCVVQAQTSENIFDKKNIIKANVVSPIISSLALSYEGVIDEIKTFQLSLFYRKTADVEGLTFPESLEGWGITPELRFYISNQKKSPVGFFIAPYLTYQQYTTTQSFFDGTFFYEEDILSNVSGFGVILGGQWVFKNVISIDLWGGPGYYFVNIGNDAIDEIILTPYTRNNAYAGRLGVNIGIAF